MTQTAEQLGTIRASSNSIVVPSLRRLSDPQRAPVNASLRLHCEFGPSDGNRHTIQWIAPSDDRPLRSDSRRKVLNNGTLIIHSLQLVDEGYFKCGLIHPQYLLTFAIRVQVASKYHSCREPGSLRFFTLISIC